MLPISLVGILVALCASTDAALSTADQQLSLDVHNQYRSAEGAVNMLQMQWDSNLATVAQMYAQQCNFQHNAARSTQYVNPTVTSYVGENLFVTSAEESPGLIVSAIQAWYNETASYNIASGSCNMNAVCGHYTQIVWSQTYLVGCGSSYCKKVAGFNSAGTIIVCDYAPGGNIGGQSPYTPGSPCSACPSQWSKCYANLCAKNNTQTTVPVPVVATAMPTVPVVNSISPNVGSLSGQTQVKISGTGFSMDQFAFNDPTLGNRVNFTRLDGLQTVSCDVIIYLTSPNQIMCTINAPPDGMAGTYMVHITVDGKSIGLLGGTYCNSKAANCQFTFQQSNTPTIILVTPLAAPIGKNITISGNLITTSIQQNDANNIDNLGDFITRVLVGGQLCSLTDSNMVQYAPISVGSAAGASSISCLPEVGKRIASMNVSMFYASRGGSSIPLTSLTVDNNLMLYNFQTYAVISSVVPSVGSNAGGTLMSIYGENFGTSINNTQVLVGGIPCKVVNVTDAVIQCITGQKPPSSTYYPGGRGLSREVWFNTYQTQTLDTIKTLNTSQANPLYRRSIIESSLSQTEYGSEFGENTVFSQRMTGFFVPPISSYYTFSLLTDDPGRFSLSPNMSAESKTIIAYSDNHTPQWTSFPSQTSTPIYLEAGSYHYLEALSQNYFGPWALIVGAKIHSLNWTSSQAAADQEVQRAIIRSVVATETHEIRILGNPPTQLISITINPNTMGQMNLTFGNQTTGPIRLINATAIQSALNSLSNIQRIGGVSVFSTDNGSSFVVVFQTHLTLTGTAIPALVAQSDNFSVTVTVVNSALSVPSTFQLGFNNDVNNMATPRLTSAVQVSNTPNAVNNAISQLFTWSCQKSQAFILFNDSYETDATNDPSSEPYCGKYSSLNHPSSLWTLVENVQSYTSLVRDYPYVCLAHRGGVPSSLFVNIGYSTPVWRTAVIDLFVNATIIRDDAVWYFNCFDIRPAIAASAAVRSGQDHSILQVYFASSTSPPFWIDEFAIAKTSITYSSRIPAVRPAGIFVNSISVSTTVPSKPVVGVSFPLLPNVTSSELLSGLQLEVVSYTVAYTVLNCGSGMGPITATFPVGQSGSVAVRQLVQGSPTVSGTFSLSFQGYKTSSLAADSTASTLQTQLQSGGKFSVFRRGTCAGYYWDITWLAAGGDQPLMVVNGTGLQGNNVTITMTTLVDGGVYIRPFRGDMLRVPYTTPQVEVLVNKIPSSCPKNNCGFGFSDSVTPKVSPFTQEGLAGDALAIYGSQFGNDLSQIVVQIGSANCPVTAANNTYIACTVGPNPAGIYDVIVSIKGVGLAQGKGSFVYRLVANSVTPTAGSIGGGETVHITGAGFNPFGPLSIMNAYQYWSNVTVQYPPAPVPNVPPQAQATANGSTVLPMFVLVGQELCAISMATYTDITCYIMPALHQPGQANVTVVVGNRQATVPTSFEFSLGHTPLISGVQPNTGSVLGNTTITVSGSNLFGDVQMSIGGSPCIILSVSESQVSCLTAPHPPGSYPILVSVNDSGNAVMENNGSAYYSLLPVYQFQLEVNGLSPALNSIFGGQLITIEGQGFGNALNTAVTIGGKPCRVVSVMSHQIGCITPPSVTTRVIKYLQDKAAWDTSQLSNLYVGDTLQWVWMLPSATVLKVTVGTTMSSTSSNGTFSITLNQPGSSISFSTYVSTYGVLSSVGPLTVGGLQNSSANIAVTVAGFSALTNIVPNNMAWSNGSQCFIPLPQGSAIVLYYLDCATPIVSSIVPTDVALVTPITISGWGFSTNPSDNVVTFGGYPCLVANSSGSQVVCSFGNNVSPPSFTLLPLTLNVVGLGNASVQANAPAVMLHPYVTSLHPVEGSTAGGTLVTIAGKGLSAANVSVRIGTGNCALVSQSYESLTCTTSVYQGGPATASVVLLYPSLPVVASAACVDANNCTYTYQQALTPKVTAVAPTELVGPTTLSINGSQFSSNVTLNKVKVGVYDCQTVLALPDYIQCVINAPPAGLYNLSVAVLDVVGGATVPLGMALISVGPLASPLRVTSLSPPSGGTQGGTVLTIVGVGFPILPSAVFVTVGNKSCQVLTSSYSVIACTSPPQASGRYPVLVKLGVNVAPAATNFSYSQSLTPNITSISPLSGQQGDNVTITGTLFPMDSSQVFVSFSGSICSVISSSPTSITCTLGPNFAGSYPITVQVVGNGYARPANTTLQFKYTLIATSVAPSSGSLAGLNTLTIYGVGFNPTSTAVTICGQVCGMASDPPQLTMLGCIVPSYAGPLQLETVACNVTVTSQNSTIVLPNAYTYSMSLTPVVSSVNRTRGGTAGGSILMISGSRLLGAANVTIAGVACAVLYQDFVQTIICETGPSGVTVRAQVMVYINGMGFAQSTGVTFFYVDVWSSPFTWGGDPIPTDGDLVVIPRGQMLLLDTSTAVLSFLLIQGQLIFDDTQPFISLKAQFILVTSGGLLQVGTEQQPYMNKAEIVLYGHVLSTELPVYGAKTLAVREGTLELHGRPLNVTWTRLAKTANAGEKTLYLTQAVDWQVGGAVVIAATGFVQTENEDATIASISSDGLSLTLSDPLNFTHIAAVQTIAGRTIETSAEVGYLTRNVVVRGNVQTEWHQDIPACPTAFLPGQFEVQSCFQGRFGAESVNDMFGSQIMIHAAMQNAGHVAARIEYIEVTHAGQAFRLGRYPIHFHLNGNVSGSYVRGCSIHHTFNRAVTIHAVNYLLVEKNVAYNIMGHAYFLEDGVEVGNVIQDNLGIFVRAASSLLNVDITPATFWIVNPNNTVRRNAAAGGTHFGFWYRLTTNPTGPSATPLVCPRSIPLGEFSNNSAHSFGWYGLWVFPSYHPQVGGGCAASSPQPVYFDNLLSWHNSRGAEFTEVGALQLRNSVLLDNALSGMVVVRVTALWGSQGAALQGTLIVGQSNITTSCTLTGIQTPESYFLTVSNVTFVNFATPDCVPIRACSHCKDFDGGFETRFEGIKFVNCTQVSQWQWPQEHVHRDMDGSLTGIRGGSLTPTHALLPRTCFNHTSTIGTVAGSVCPAGIQFGRFAVYNPSPSSLTFMEAAMLNQDGGKITLPYVKKRIAPPNGYMALLPLNAAYQFQWPLSTYITNISYRALISGLTPNDYFVIRYQYPQPLDVTQVNGITTSNQTSVANPVLARTGNWFIDTNNTLHYVVKGVNTVPNDFDYLFQTYNCYYINCTPPAQPTLAPPTTLAPAGRPNVTRTWSSLFPTNVTSRTAIFINCSVYVIVDVSAIVVDNLTICGGLEFVNGMNYVLDANLILILGAGRLVVGYQNAPYTGSLVITLHGTAFSPEFQFKNPARGPVVGAKAIGVFGQMSLYGKQRSTWTRLAKPALVGQSSLTLINPVDWNPNETIVVTSTSFDPSETEVFKVVSVLGAVVTLNATLQYNHTVEAETLGTLSYSVSAEVGLLTRNIVIQGDQSTTGFGCRVLIGTYQDTSGRIYTGSAQIVGVEISGCGQLGYNEAYDPRYSLVFLNTLSNNYVNGCSIHDGYNTGLGVFGTDAMVIAGNVIHVTVGPAMFVTGSNHQVIQNLASLTLFPGTYGDANEPGNSLWTANFELANTQGLTLVGNSAAGGARAGYHLNGEPCSSSSASGVVFAQAPSSSIYDNVAHSSLHGIHLGYSDGQPGGCARFHRFTIFSCFHYGFSSFGISGAWITNSVFVNNFAAIIVTVIGPPAITHIAGDKPVLIQDSIIVGASPVYQTKCAGDSHQPPIASHHTSFFGIQSPYGGGHVGVVLTTFTSLPALYPKQPWFEFRSYPAINGLTEMRNVTFAHFKQRCTSVMDVALITNPISQNGIHPTTLRQVNLYDVQMNASLFIHQPRLQAINPSDCVDMDCDGFKKVLIRDLDGSFTGYNDGKLHTIISLAEFAWGNQQRGIGDYRIPPAMLTFPNGSKESAALTYPAKGIVRGTAFGSSANCAYNARWNAYQCSQLDHLMFVLESLDIDTEIRRLSPIGLGANGFIDLINGPEDFGWCGGYTCQERISTFYMIVATGISYSIGLTSTNPQNTSLRLLNANSSQAIVVGIIYKNPQRLDIYYQGNYVPPTNADRTSADLKYILNPANRTSFAPLISDVVGTNYYDRQLKQIFVVIKGSSPIIVVTTPVVQVSLSLFVTAGEFFNEDMLVRNIAFLLGIPSNKIRIVNIVRESGSVGKRQTGTAVQLSFEIGNSPVQQIATSTNSTTNITASTNVTNSTSSNTNATNISGNSSTSAGQTSLNYSSLVMLTTTLANVIQTGELALALNGTIDAASLVQPVAPPAPPPPPATNDTGGPQPDSNTTLVPLGEQAVQQAINATIQQPSVVLSIPTALQVVSLPRMSIEGVIFQSPIRIAMYDDNGAVATTLGVGISWICTAVIASGPSAAILTSFNANFSNGIATFSNLVISFPGNYTLLFTVTYPTNAQFNITTQSFTITTRQLKLVATSYPSTGTALVPLYPYPTLTLVDSQTGALVQDLSWRNSTWYASVVVKSTSGAIYQSWTVPFQMGVAIFKNVVVTTSGSYVLVFSAVTDPSSALVPSLTTPSFVVNSVPIARFIIIYQANYTAIVSGREELFKNSFRETVQRMYPQVVIYNITVESGSIVVTFFAGAQTTQSIQDFVLALSSSSGISTLSFNFSGQILVPSNITQDQSYSVSGSAASSTTWHLILFIVVPIVVVLGCIVAVICCGALCCHWCGRSNKAKVALSNYMYEHNEATKNIYGLESDVASIHLVPISTAITTKNDSFPTAFETNNEEFVISAETFVNNNNYNNNNNNNNNQDHKKYERVISATNPTYRHPVLPVIVPPHTPDNNDSSRKL